LRLTGALEFYNRFAGRSALLEYASEKQIPVQQTAAKPWSTDENLFHISYEAGILEDPNTTPPADMWKLTTDPERAPDAPERLTIEFKLGLPVRVSVAGGKDVTGAVEIFMALNALGRKHGVGRIDIVENRFIGVKSRGCYETPAGTILRAAHVDLEGLTLDRNVRALRDQFVTIELGRILYNGHFFTPEREFITAAIPASQRTVNGVVKLKLYKGNVIIEGRSSDEVPTEWMHQTMRSSSFRVCTTRSTSPWTSSVVSSPPTPPASSRLSLFGSRRACLVFLIRQFAALIAPADGQKRTFARARRASLPRMCTARGYR
jgi:argininosuccinate synthase